MPSFGSILAVRLKKYFLRNKTFLFFKIESWNLKWILLNLTKFQLIPLIQTIVAFIFSIGCLIELKFCEVSAKAFSNRCWKCQSSILKNKKVLFLRKVFFKQLSIWKQKSFVYWLNFTEGFGSILWNTWARRYPSV